MGTGRPSYANRPSFTGRTRSSLLAVHPFTVRNRTATVPGARPVVAVFAPGPRVASLSFLARVAFLSAHTLSAR